VYGFARDMLGIYITSGEIKEPDQEEDRHEKDTIGRPDSPASNKELKDLRPNVHLRMKYVDGFSIRYEGKLDIKNMEIRGKWFSGGSEGNFMLRKKKEYLVHKVFDFVKST
jgi:hypothetical protein